MTPEERLGDIVIALESVGVSCLVMGGHAVRFYGLARNTNDFDLKVSPDQWDDLARRLSSTGLFGCRPAVEGPSWRATRFGDFASGRCLTGRMSGSSSPRENHLLASHAELLARRTRPVREPRNRIPRPPGPHPQQGNRT